MGVSRFPRIKLRVLLAACGALAAVTATSQPSVSVKIDTRAYAVCEMLGADAAGHMIKGGFGTLVKPATQHQNHITWKCVGQGVVNEIEKDLELEGFKCVVIDSAGTRQLATRSTAKISSTGSEILSCSYSS